MIGFVLCECMIYDAESLKEKRSVLKSVITRIKHRCNVAVSELDHHDIWQRTAIGIVTVATKQVRAEQELQKAIAIVDQTLELELVNTTFEWL